MHWLIRYSHWLIFALGTAVTVWAAVYVDMQIARKAQDSFSLRVQDVESAVVRRLRSYEDILFGIAGLYRASDKVSPEEFDSYGESLNIKERYPALQAINFGQYFLRNDLEMFMRGYRSDTGDRNRNIPLALPADRAEYMVLTRTYPPEVAPTLGIDVFRNSARSTPRNGKSIVQSQEFFPNEVFSSGMPLSCAGISFSAFAARLGIFKPDGNNVPKLIGTAGIGFDIPNFFREAIPEKLARTLHYRMVNIGRLDGSRYDPPIAVFDSREIGTGINPDRIPDEDLLKKYFDIPFGGTLLRIEVTEHRDIALEHYEKFLPMAVLAGGLLFFGGISMTSRRMQSDNAALDMAVNERTVELQCEINRTKSLERELSVVIESERTRIGRELHDDLGQRLTGISVSAEILASGLLSIDQKLARQADDIGKATSEAMLQVRTLAHGLMPVASGPEGLREALAHLAANVTRLSGINCTFDFNDPVDVTDENVSAHLYRITQEAVNNAIRHARAGSIEIQLDERNGKVSLSISDDGCGFDSHDPEFRSGLGLNTIAYRASIINYDVKIVSSSGNGTVIRVTQT
ncbi:hypothetical protein EGT07_12600 [Herbaspirillum sp. HC18]|nr:hypothetical protein EGT07_12600 [Herbaspirillum sp. HC18]